MEEKESRNHEEKNAYFVEILALAQKGDNSAMESLLEMFDQDIKNSARFINMNYEEAVQAIKVELISMVRNEKK